MQSKTHRPADVTSTDNMDEQKTHKTVVKRPDVLRKLNKENLLMIERGLLGDLPDRFKPPPPGPVRGRPPNLVITKPQSQSFLSACLPMAQDSPVTPSDDEASPLKKSFSFREKFSRLSFLSKHRDKVKVETIAEDGNPEILEEKFGSKLDQEQRASKRFWFFRNKEIERRDGHHVPIYKRSRSFEFLPRAIEEEMGRHVIEKGNIESTLRNSQSFVYGSSDTMGEAWVSNESLEFLCPSTGKYTEVKDEVSTLHSIKETASDHGSSPSTVTSGNSSGGIDILQRGSVQDLLDEFEKTVDMFSESYLSDCEPYTKSGEKELPKKEKRKSSSYSTLPSPKVVQLNALKVSEISEDFKRELSLAVSANRDNRLRVSAGINRGSSRRGSVTDWFVLDENAAPPSDKYRRKPTKRVRRTSSTKYWITPEECAVYSREQRPPLVIPRITQYRGQRTHVPHNHTVARSYPEETYQEPSVKASSVRHYDRMPEWSPTPDHYELDQYSKASSDSPRPIRVLTRNRLAGSTENLLMRRPNQLHLPASSSGDSLDIEVREKEPRSRRVKSMVPSKPRRRSPVPAPRMLLQNPPAEPGSFQASVVQEGPVKRTKFSESGKKCKKNWTECYMLLTQTALHFYKDQRTYYATKIPKPPGTPPSPTAPRPEMVLALKNAHVVQCIQMHTRRHSRSLVLTVGYDQYLLQDETEEGAKRWLSRIQNVIYKLGPPTTDDYPTPQSQSSNTDLESIGRTPPLASRQPHRPKQKAGGSSNEDLSDEKSHVKSRLRKFFAKRPAMEVLVKKGIYKDEPVFGRNLEEVCPSEPGRPRVPEFVINCVNEIERSEENMCTDGLYRASGNLSQVQKIRLEIDQNNMNIIQNNPDIHVLTGSLKLFFRELKEPLIPCGTFDRVLNACSIKPREARVKEFRDIVSSLPQCNKDTLKYLLEHLLRVTQYSERNRMHTANLAIVFGPTLLWAPAEQAHNIAVDCIQQNNVVDILLTDFKEIFAEDTGKKKKA